MKKQVVFVDDERPFLEGMRRNLLDMSDIWDMHFLSDPAAAHEHIVNGPDAVVVLDWMMPNVDGLDFANTVREAVAQRDESFVYIILMTAKRDASDAAVALESGVDDYIAKPVDMRELKARIHVGERLIASERLTRTRADLAVDQSEERLRETVEMLPEIVYETDAAGIITFVNRKAYRTLGCSYVEMMNAYDLVSMFAPEERDKVEALKERLKNQEFIGSVESAIRCKNGRIIPVIHHMSAIVRDDKVVGFRGLIIDIADRKETEILFKRAKEQTDRTNTELYQAVQLTNKMFARIEAECETKNAMIARVSDEIQEPIALVIDTTEQLLNSELDDQQRHYVETINTNAVALAIAIEDIVKYAKSVTPDTPIPQPPLHD